MNRKLFVLSDDKSDLLVQGQYRTTYCQTYMDTTTTRLMSGVAWSRYKSE